MLKAVLTSHITASNDSVTKFYSLLETTETKRQEEMLTETHRACCSLVKHQVSQHVLWKRRADVTPVGTDNSQATALLMTVTTLEECSKGSWLTEEKVSHG